MSKITLSPLPEWRAIVKSVLTKPPKEEELAEPWLSKDSDVPYWFSRSTFTMLAISQWWEVYTDKKLPTIWIPDYFCNEPLQFLRKSNFPLNFYPITNQLLPDWETCQDQALSLKPDIFILVHYFGYPSDGKGALKFCNEHKCILVEDAAHSLIPHQDIGLYGEFVFYSPHKLLAIPNGAVLIQRPKTKVLRELSNKNPVEVMNQVLATMPQDSPSTWFWMFKRNLQKLLPDFLWLTRQKANNIDDVSYGPIPFKPLQSRLSRRLLSTEIPHINEYALSRQINQAILRAYYNSSEEKAQLIKNDYVPYMTDFGCKTKNHAEKYFQLLKEKGSPVMDWPDLPPEVLTESENHLVAIELKKTKLFFPIHQGLGISAVKKIGSSFGTKLPETLDENNYEIEWYNGGKEKWFEWISKTETPNFMQLWEYGEVKKTIESCKVKRGLIKHNGQTVAIFQTLEKSLGPVSVIRINRGPLIINGNVDFNTKYNIYKTLRETYRWWKGKILLIAPALVESPENLGVLALAHFRKRTAKQWHSSMIDLSLEENEIRKKLNGKWRNQLKKAEKSNIKIKIDNSDVSLFWLLDRYKQMMKDKSFKGPGVQLYIDLHSLNKNNLYVFQALLDGQAVAGILIVRHGTSCTY